MTFADLGLIDPLLQALTALEHSSPTPIQRQAIPAVLAGRDLMAAAQTGTGKTAGFTLPILQLLSSRDPGLSLKRFLPRCLILVPTRELAVQVHDSVRTYGKHLRLKSAAIYGGVGMGSQLTALKNGVDIIVATPGRLLDHIEQKSANLSAIELLVLDEADRMLDMGFIRDIRRILALLPKKKQSLLFSATFSDDIRALATGLLHDPVSVEVARRNAPAEAVAQAVYHVDRERKKDLLIKLIDEQRWHQVLVFTRTKHGADALADRLAKAGIRSAALHGNKSQNQRQRAGRLQALETAGAGGHRHRGARHRHRRTAAGGELRAAQCSGRLCASHRPHRPCRQLGAGGVAGVYRRAQAAARHRAPAQARHRKTHRARLRTGSAHQGRADPEAPPGSAVAPSGHARTDNGAFIAGAYR